MEKERERKRKKKRRGFLPRRWSQWPQTASKHSSLCLFFGRMKAQRVLKRVLMVYCHFPGLYGEP